MKCVGMLLCCLLFTSQALARPGERHELTPSQDKAESIATPCSVNAYGDTRLPPRPLGFEITSCDCKAAISCAVRRYTKSAGNLLRFRFTAWFSRLVVVPYNFAKS